MTATDIDDPNYPRAEVIRDLGNALTGQIADLWLHSMTAHQGDYAIKMNALARACGQWIKLELPPSEWNRAVAGFVNAVCDGLNPETEA